MAASDGKFVASVSTYGVGGANAHVVVESFETVEQVQAAAAIIREPKTATTPLYLFAIGTLTEGSLDRWQTTLTSHFENLAEPRVLRSLSRELTRQARASPYRSFAVGPALTPSLKWSKTALVSAKPKLCLVFAGQGPQHIFMGRQLSEAYPAFLDAIKANDEILVNKYGQPSFVERSGLFVPGKQATLAANGVWPVADVVVSLVFIQIALTDLLKSVGIKYDYVIGHSIGEIAMGYASGHYDRETAVGIAVGRAAAMTQAEGNGGMVALGVGVQKAKLMIKKVLARAGVETGLWIAGINSPKAVTIAGQIELIDLMVEVAADPSDKVFAAKLRVTCAFHTPLMEAQENVFKDFVKGALTATREPVAKVMSTVDGKWLERDLDVHTAGTTFVNPSFSVPPSTRSFRNSAPITFHSSKSPLTLFSSLTSRKSEETPSPSFVVPTPRCLLRTPASTSNSLRVLVAC
jgi:acyl transferase domain-containing protein